MRKFKTSFGEVVDLDDPITYDLLPNDVKILDGIMFKEIGIALCYINYFHPEIFPIDMPIGKIDCGYSQRIRVENLIKSFTDDRKNNYSNVMWYKEQIYIFQDETENMC